MKNPTVIPITIRKNNEGETGPVSRQPGTRERVLASLYQRKRAIESVIRLLEMYAETQQSQRAECIELTAGRRCS